MPPRSRHSKGLPKQAIVLAAGRGERLRPLTDRIPKPLVSVRGRPLLDQHLHRLRRAGVTRCVINIEHLGALIEAHVGNGSRYGLDVTFSREPPGALETAGGIKHALPHLEPLPFICVNADVYCDFDFGSLPYRPSSDAHLVMVNNPRYHPHGDFSLRGNRITNDLLPRYTFSGIAVYDPTLFEFARAPRRIPLAPILRNAAAGGVVTGEMHRGLWFDIGTPLRLATADQRLTEK